MSEQPKKRPLVDQSSYDLAAHWLSHDYVMGPNAGDESLEDAMWDLADYIQSTIEDWMGDAHLHGRIKERSEP